MHGLRRQQTKNKWTASENTTHSFDLRRHVYGVLPRRELSQGEKTPHDTLLGLIINERQPSKSRHGMWRWERREFADSPEHTCQLYQPRMALEQKRAMKVWLRKHFVSNHRSELSEAEFQGLIV